MLSLRRTLFSSSLAAALACLAGGFWLAGAWWGSVSVVVAVGLLAYAAVARASWREALRISGLVGVFGLAAVGLAAGAPPILMFAGATAALAAWDVTGAERPAVEGAPEGSLQRLEARHARRLVLALGLGLLLAASAKLVTLRVPFALLLLVILADVFALYRAARAAGMQ